MFYIYIFCCSKPYLVLITLVNIPNYGNFCISVNLKVSRNHSKTQQTLLKIELINCDWNYAILFRKTENRQTSEMIPKINKNKLFEQKYAYL